MGDRGARPRLTPPAIVARLHGELQAVLALPDVKERLAAQGVTARGSTPEAARQLLAADVEKWRQVIERAKIERQ